MINRKNNKLNNSKIINKYYKIINKYNNKIKYKINKNKNN